MGASSELVYRREDRNLEETGCFCPEFGLLLLCLN